MEAWIAAGVAAVLAVIAAIFFGSRSKNPASGPPGSGSGSGSSGGPLSEPPSPPKTPEEEGEPAPSGNGSQPAPSGSGSPPKPGEGGPEPGKSAPSEGGLDAGKKAEELSPVAPFDPSASSGGLLVKAVEAGEFEGPLWVAVEWDGLEIEVGAHALRAKVGDKLLRLPVSWAETVGICQKLDWCPLTSDLSDAVWKAATLRPNPTPIGDFSTPEKAAATSKKMRRLEFCLTHNTKVDAQIPEARAAELASTEGKDWILSKRNLTAAKAATTYGWHQSNGKPIQSLGPDGTKPAHDDAHFDQTQVLRPIRRKAKRKSDGAVVDLLDELESRGLPKEVTAPLRKQG
ncbi:MAG: hypothetical protein R3B70_11085 [Polyangiaceae bacterium]